MEELARRANVQMQSQHRSTLQYKDVGKFCLTFFVERQMLMTCSNKALVRFLQRQWSMTGRLCYFSQVIVALCSVAAD